MRGQGAAADRKVRGMKHSERSQERLARSLQMLAEIESGSKTPARVETAVMARWDARHTKRGPSRARRVMRVATSIARGKCLRT